MTVTNESNSVAPGPPPSAPRRKFRSWPVVITLLVVLAGSFLLVQALQPNELARLAFTESSEESAVVNLDATKTVRLWVNLDVSSSGSGGFERLGYEIHAAQAGQQVDATYCDALRPDLTLNSMEINSPAGTSRSYTGRMRCTLSIPATGPTTIQARIVAEGHAMEIEQFDLVVSQ